MHRNAALHRRNRASTLGSVACLACLALAACEPGDDYGEDYGVRRPDAEVSSGWPRGFDPPGDCGEVLGVPLDALFDADVARIALLLPESGPAGAVGTQMTRAVAMALEELDAAGGLGDGRHLGALACDTRTDPERAFDIASWMLADFDVPAVIGPGLSASTVLLDGGGLIVGGPTFVSPSATHPDLARLEDEGRFWRTAPDDRRLGLALGRWMGRQGVARLAIVAPDHRFGDAVAQGVIGGLCPDGCPAGRTRVVRYAGGVEPQVIAAEIRAVAPEGIVFLGQRDDTAPLLAAVADLDVPIGLNEDLRDPGLFAELPPALLTRIGGVNHGAPDSPTARGFVERFRARWGADPGPYAAHAYDAAWLVAHALGALPPGTPETGAAVAARLERMSLGARISAGPDDWAAGQAAFRDPAAGTFDFDGASGALDFDATGQAPDAIEGWRVTPEGRIERLGVWLDAADGWRGP